MEGERRREQMEGKETTGDEMKGIKSCCFILEDGQKKSCGADWIQNLCARQISRHDTSSLLYLHRILLFPSIFAKADSVRMKLCRWGITGGKSSFLFPLRSFSLNAWGGGIRAKQSSQSGDRWRRRVPHIATHL